MNDYEVMYVDEYNIGQAIDFIDIDDMAQHIYFGPQAEIKEKLNEFNQRNHCNLSVTKTFRWSPGTYDKIAEMMMTRVGFRRRASGMYNNLSRENYWWESGRIGIQSDLREMDRLISTLRYNGARWMENTDELREKKELFKNHVCEKFEQMISMIEKTDNITLLNVLLENNHTATPRGLRMTINLCLHPTEMQIYNASRGGEPTHVQNIPMEMDVMLKLSFYPLEVMSRGGNYNVHVRGLAEPYDERGRLLFPYISQNRYNNTPGRYGTVCFGDDSTDIDRSLRNFELPAFALLLMNWMNRYTQNTNPYNNIKMAYHGEPKWLSGDYRAIFGTNNWDACTYTPSGHDDYCDTNECALRHRCEYYKQAYPEPVTPEQAEQLTLQWATIMGWIGAPAAPTITHSVNEDDEPTSTTTDLPIQGDREQFDPEALVEELDRQSEEDRINAEMDAEEATLEEAMRHLNNINQETEE